MNIAGFLLIVLECIVSVVALVLVFIAFVYYFSNFIEEKMKKCKVIIKYLTYLVLAISLLLPLSGFPWYIFAVVFVTHVLWLRIQNSGFPFISLDNPVLFISFICTIFSHFLFMLHYLSEDAPFFRVVSYFFLFVWLIPILILSSLCALDEDQIQQGTNTTERLPANVKSKSVFNTIIGRLLKKAETNLPISGRKGD
jgi:hypothetical protein